MNLATSDFVPLDRRFERADASDAVGYWAEVLADGDIPRDWSWLRTQSRVVALLAQAGSGKTAEFMHQVDGARASKRDAFFFRVERLCSGQFEDAHETPACKTLFAEWLGSDRSAEIFLDAVDEAKLPQARTARPFRDALRAIEFVLGHHLNRITVFVSCRSSEWIDAVEQKALTELAERMSVSSPSREAVTVFNATFAPLDLSRVRLLAEKHGGDEAIATLIDSEAISDIATPLDAILYLDTYVAFAGTLDLAARFASRGLLLETSVRRRLLEQGGETRRSQVEFSTGLRAAQFLAFGSVMAQTMDFAIGGPRQGCVDPEELLASGHAGLSVDGVRQLLACSLFVPAGQARVQFYRREARDMLAAQWLRDRIEEGASALSIINGFIRIVFGKPRVPTVYAGMLAWLASYDPVTRRRMIEAAPEWIIEGGDPRSLALADRLDAFKKHFELGPHRFHGEFVFEVRELRRFARPELERAIVSDLATPPSGDLFDHLMQFVEAGRYPSAAPFLVGLINDFSRSAGDRMFAVRALIACGTDDDLRAVARHFVATGGPAVSEKVIFEVGRNDHFITDLVTAAYPRAVGADDALSLIAQLGGKKSGYESKSLAELMASGPDKDLEIWFVGLDRICFEPPHPEYKPFRYEAPPATARAAMLMPGFQHVAAKYLRRVQSFDFNRDLLIYDRVWQSRDLRGGYTSAGRVSPLRSAVTERAAFRRALYNKLANVGCRRHTASEYVERLDLPAYYSSALGEDLSWFLACYRTSSGEERRDFAQSADFLTHLRKGTDRLKMRLTIAAMALAQIRPDWPVVRMVTTDPLLAPWRRYRVRRRYRRGDLDAGLRGLLRSFVSHLRRQVGIWINWNSLQQGTSVNLLVHLVLDDGHSEPTETELTDRLGRRLGATVVEGAMAFARRYKPIRRGRSIFGDDLLAQAGYRYIWNNDRSMPSVVPTAGLRAALLFALEWPDWATDLAVANPKEWKEFILPLLLQEIESAKHEKNAFPGRTLSAVSHLDEGLKAALSASLLEALSKISAAIAADVERIVLILRADPSIEAQVPALAATQAHKARIAGLFDVALAWLYYWAERDEAGLTELLDLMRQDVSLVLDGLGIYGRLLGEQSAMATPSLAIRYEFADLAYSCIRPSDDPPAKDGVHTVTRRDDLQHLRSSIGEAIGSTYDDAERNALEKLIQEHVAPVSNGWAERWRNRFEQSAVRPAAWSHATIIAAGRELASAPTSGDELHARIAQMISDLEVELASSEFDRRGLFPDTIHESDFRAWLGHALDSRRRPWFSIVQEAETALSKRTDLRIELRGTGNAIVVVEIKLLHGWRPDELLDKFDTQLVDQYLISAKVRHGIYLLVDLGRTPKGALPDGSRPTATEIAATLNCAAETRAHSGGPVATAQVFTITPTKRNLRRGGTPAKA